MKNILEELSAKTLEEGYERHRVSQKGRKQSKEDVRGWEKHSLQVVHCSEPEHQHALATFLVNGERWKIKLQRLNPPIFIGLRVSETEFWPLRLLLALNKHEEICTWKDMKEKDLQMKPIAECLST